MKYVQCKLTNGSKVDIAFIPLDKAIKGRTIILKETGKTFIIDDVFKDSIKEKENINQVGEFKKIEIAGRRSYKEKGK